MAIVGDSVNKGMAIIFEPNEIDVRMNQPDRIAQGTLPNGIQIIGGYCHRESSPQFEKRFGMT